MQFGFEQCPYCGSQKGFIYVHGHYQCSACAQNVMPCCGGEQETNYTNNEEEYPNKNKDKTHNARL